jgi:pimeloyl-ACP methyl ester carboxylesterase
MPTVSLTGSELYYEARGDGDATLVFAHGAGGNHLSWWQQIPYFAQRYRCVTIDHRGFGQSSDDSGESISAYRRDLEELLDHLGVESVAIIGQSMGGFTAMSFAGAHPDRTWAVVMANTFLGVGDEGLVAKARQHWESLDQIDPASTAAEQTVMVGPRYKREHREGLFLYQQLRALNPPLDLPSTYSLEDGAAPLEVLANLDVAVLFIAGEEDAVIPIEITAEAEQRVGGSRLVRVPEAGHSLYWEQPDVFNREVGAFLEAARSG